MQVGAGDERDAVIVVCLVRGIVGDDCCCRGNGDEDEREQPDDWEGFHYGDLFSPEDI